MVMLLRADGVTEQLPAVSLAVNSRGTLRQQIRSFCYLESSAIINGRPTNIAYANAIKKLLAQPYCYICDRISFANEFVFTNRTEEKSVYSLCDENQITLNASNTN
jgi:hypothetical protein